MEKKREQREPDKKVLSFFLIMFPTIIVIVIGMLAPSIWWAMVALAIYQAIMLKQFLDNYYRK